MHILFCSNPLDKKLVDPDFTEEFSAAKENEFSVHLFDFELLTGESDIKSATRRIKPGATRQIIVYRGWMLKPKHYALLYDSLLEKNFQLINTPVEYTNCHYLPNSYQFIQSNTPETRWLYLENKQPNLQDLSKALDAFGDSPVIIKDFVKSQKHYWDTACYINAASDRAKAMEVIEKFLALQGDDLNEGLVIRKFVDLQDLSIHSKSGMPLKLEYRLFFKHHKLVGWYDYWEEGDYKQGEIPPIGEFMSIAKSVASNFFSMDIAKTKEGKWIIIELGDGQVAGLPDKINKKEFYKLLAVE